MRVVVHAVGELFITAGCLLLLFVAWQLWWTDVEADREQAAITEALQREWEQTPAVPTQLPAEPVDHGPPPDLEAPADGDAFGILHVPAFGPDWQTRPVVEGTGLDLLERGIGHYEGSAMPGEVGNFSLAGHRVTYGRPFHQIAELQAQDALVVETADAWYVYRVREHQIVTPDRVDVVAAVPGDPQAQPTERLITLTACHPMYSARERYIVHGVLERWQPKTAGTPAELGGA
ncbi:class E sortase [Thalassiella azotivora]